ncbi:hypothetical protein MKA27_13400 [[Clostridium] innocuum]|uniref:hypothetical protein n=1 Tax=Clostridium innocuum TaxID=1522 RepID=UPI000D6DAB34|nr:hypothetical protein [[Clostridium] innocuum]MCR0316886.1 hypothetical protein [[Clostridium] innocuum]MCR0369672.1 hypothetical protein [[Clostridium] innocuum]MCR0374816.1 hypothetical protein [[Clostridium] innocuum]MCR0559625.1 hypothetical protein [[Clostridium] innocuum]MCR0602681.1 hypothetical protein [[Clostridium] innocuum]
MKEKIEKNKYIIILVVLVIVFGSLFLLQNRDTDKPVIKQDISEKKGYDALPKGVRQVADKDILNQGVYSYQSGNKTYVLFSNGKANDKDNYTYSVEIRESDGQVTLHYSKVPFESDKDTKDSKISVSVYSFEDVKVDLIENKNDVIMS